MPKLAGGPARTGYRRVAVFLQHADLAALRRLLDWAADATDTPPERFGGSVH